ncbi:ATP-binding cassette domain-containing protein [Alteromonas sediminis]|uniref:ATP-binding cassette domain-containing protein n=1 Tax=Alteromonas sediminis TaxID=2259342 RepID=A0A3N5Z897_9ALTE|nr:ATP-binding cassette domain-containing protein [Alteromonas sediminis]RPJ67014.1 ATP-binding cassette domain-containing protein [Alteromonas sediminis]
MLEIYSLSIDVADRRIVSTINASLAPGQSMAILGANGAGKSTLLSALSKERMPAKGSIVLKGKNIHGMPLRTLATSRAVMQQQQPLSFDFTVLEYLLLARACHNEPKQQSMLFLSQVVSELHLSDFLECQLSRLSGGERQRIEFAKVWLQVLDENDVNGKLLLLDEPTSALDIRQQRLFFKHLHRFCQRGGMVLTVLHDINQAAQHMDHLLLLLKGNQLACGPVAKVFTSSNIQRCFNVDGQVTWLSGHRFPQFFTHAINQEIA